MIGETILNRMPIVRGIYKSVKQIFETVFSQTGTGFRRVGLVEFPSKGMWSIVFISTPPSPSISQHLPGREHMSVFLPCTPNPTTGFYFYLPVEDVIEVPLSPDEAAKLIMSAGLIQPEIRGCAEVVLDYGLQKYHRYKRSSTMIDFTTMEVVRIGSCYELIQDVLGRHFGVELPPDPGLDALPRAMCARRSVVSSTRISVRRVARADASSPAALASLSCTLAISRYQSQYSSQTNW